jgi:hypothetical protein
VLGATKWKKLKITFGLLVSFLSTSLLSHFVISGEGIDVVRYEYWEEEEQEENRDHLKQWISLVKTEDVLHDDSINLIETTEGVLVMNSSNYPELPGYQIFRGWAVHRTITGGDEKGWVYDSSCQQKLRRKRLWEQLFVRNSQCDQAAILVTHFHSKFRAINLSFIRRALGSQEFHIQMVLECQRLSAGLYSSNNLQPFDPPAWSRAPSDSQSPCDIPESALVPISMDSFQIPSGWKYLHDFMFTSYPSRDLSGWQYSNGFEFDQISSSQFLPSLAENSKVHTETKKDLYQVRRRLWIRTIVKESELIHCRHLFSNYISSHPRGHILATRLYRQSHFRKRWCFGIGLLIDKEIHIFLDKNYQSHITYHLEGCEVTVLSQRPRNPEPATTSTSDHPTPPHRDHNPESHHPFPLLGSPQVPRKFYLFGLKYISCQDGRGGTTGEPSLSSSATARELEGSMQCILSTLTNKDRDLWISALSHQLVLVNQHRYPLPTAYSVRLGPSVSDSITLCGQLWRRIHQTWKLNYFELRSNGTFSCFENGILVTEFSSWKSQTSIQIPGDISFHFPFGIYSNGELSLMLSSESSSGRQSWMTLLHRQIELTTNQRLSPTSPAAITESNGSLSNEWFDSFDLLSRSDSPHHLQQTLEPSIDATLLDNSLFHHSREVNQSVTGGLSLSSSALVQYLRGKMKNPIQSLYIYEPVMNLRIESYNTLRESNDQFSDLLGGNEEEGEDDDEDDDESIHSLATLVYSEIFKK